MNMPMMGMMDEGKMGKMMDMMKQNGWLRDHECTNQSLPVEFHEHPPMLSSDI
jgi:hypothetical protein